MDTFKRGPFVEFKLPQGHSGADMLSLSFLFCFVFFKKKIILLSNQLRTQLTLSRGKTVTCKLEDVIFKTSFCISFPTE